MSKPSSNDDGDGIGASADILTPLVEAAHWAHAQCKFFNPAQLTKAPVAVERDIIGLSPEERRTVRQERSRPWVEALGIWLRGQYARLPAAIVGPAITTSFVVVRPALATALIDERARSMY